MLIATTAIHGIRNDLKIGDLRGFKKETTQSTTSVEKPMTWAIVALNGGYMWQPTKDNLKLALKFLSAEYGQDYFLIDKIINCESGWRTDVYSWNMSSYGIAQFQKATWDDFNKIRGMSTDYCNPFQQLEMMVWAFKNGYKDRWDCFRMN